MTYVRNCWYVAGWETDLELNKPFAVTVLDEPIVLWRDQHGQLAALEDRCVHRLAALSLGRCEGANLRCMYHGLLFNAAGQVIEIPGQAKIPPQARVKSYPVVARHSWLWIWMGDPATADIDLIPPAVGYDQSDFILGHGFLDYDAEARLINDNLLDFSHLTFVHANSFGAGSVFSDTLPTITPLDRGIRVSRWAENVPGMRMGADEVLCDNFQTYDFLLPGILLMQSANFAPGTAARMGRDSPDFAEAASARNFTSQAVTPTLAKAARYFFSWGPHRDHGNEEVRDGMMALAGVAFGEDKVMIEAQQKIIDRTPNPRVMPSAHDRGVTLFNRLVERLSRAEQANIRPPSEAYVREDIL